MRLTKKTITNTKNYRKKSIKRKKVLKEKPMKELNGRILNINIRKIRSILEEQNAKLVQSNRLMSVSYYKKPNLKKNSSIRLRDEGEHFTLTIRIGHKENTITIDSRDEADAILKSLGCKLHYKVEKLREHWRLYDSNEIIFDTYPGLPTYMEINCSAMKYLRIISKIFGFKTEDYVKKTSKEMYSYYYSIKLKNKHIEKGAFTFDKSQKFILPSIKKNKSIYINLIKSQLSFVKNNSNKLRKDKPSNKEKSVIISVSRSERFGGENPTLKLSKYLYKYFNNKVPLERTGLSVVYKQIRKEVIEKKLFGLILFGYYKLEEEIPLRIYITQQSKSIVLSVKGICSTLINDYFKDKKERYRLVEEIARVRNLL
jgi:adenylate cyclase class IV